MFELFINIFYAQEMFVLFDDIATQTYFPLHLFYT